jgi:aspartyl protease family protein
MLPKSFYLLMLPLGVAAVLRPEAFTMLTGMVGAEAPAPQAQVARPAPDAPAWPLRRVVPGQGGHFKVNARAEGRPLVMLVDTGATLVALTWESALALNLVAPGALGVNLLGMSYLTRLRRFEFAQNSLVLEQ